MRSALTFGVIGLFVLASPAAAHVEFKKAKAEPGKQISATLVVGHGCGKSPTVRLRLQAPPGVWIKGAAPLEGWTISEKSAPLDEGFSYAGAKASDGITELTWTGKLDSHAHGGFSFEMILADQLRAGARVKFPVVQECEEGVHRWIDTEDGDESPAPSLTVGAGT